jgi:hypothetical protein
LILHPFERPARRSVSTQLESRHFLKTGDAVQHVGGHAGAVVEAFALYAVVRWEDGRQEEVDQLDPRVFVTERAARE